MKIEKLPDGNYRIEGLHLSTAPSTPEGTYSVWTLEITGDELARLSILAAEMLMAHPAAAFVAG